MNTVTSYIGADTRRHSLQQAEDEAHPERTSWTKALYILQLDTTNAHN